jgi:protein-L-isoaspartate(D-aspartate) O-methyltransferase
VAAFGTACDDNNKLINFNHLQENNTMNIDFSRQQMVRQQVRVWDVSKIPLLYGHVMLRPTIEGRLLQALDLHADDQVLEIGTGTGYLTACLAGLSASVSSIDIHEEFIAAANRNLENAEVSNANVQCMDAMAELPAGEFDAIAVTASMPRIDERFVDALKPGGRLFLVVGESPVMSALLITRDDDDLQQRALFETDLPAMENIAGESIFSF